jgi:hypothetical protein
MHRKLFTAMGVVFTLAGVVAISGCNNEASKEPVPQSANELRTDRSKMTPEDKKLMEEGMRRAAEQMKRPGNR